MCQTFLRVFSVKQTCILRSPLKGGGGWAADYPVKKTRVFFVSNASLPVDVGRSKTPLLETPIYKKIQVPSFSRQTATVTKTSLKK